MSRTLLKLSLGGLLCLGSYSVISALAATPAFNGALQEQDVTGRKQVRHRLAMYDYPNYLLQMGTTFVRADFLPTGTSVIDGMTERASTEVVKTRGDRAVGLLARSVALDPANAWTWRQLAWGLTLSGNTSEARVALERSWTLAPYSRQLASTRLDLAQVLFDDPVPGLDTAPAMRPTPEEKAAVARDLDTLQKLSTSRYRFYRENLSDQLR